MCVVVDEQSAAASLRGNRNNAMEHLAGLIAIAFYCHLLLLISRRDEDPQAHQIIDSKMINNSFRKIGIRGNSHIFSSTIFSRKKT